MLNFTISDIEGANACGVALSVVIPCHNPEALFFSQFKKLAAANPNWQFIVVDDGSDRDLRDFLPKAANVTVLRNDVAQGAGASRNIGLQAVKGDYTLFWDDDDAMDWRVVEQLMQKMDEATAVDMAVSSYQVIKDGKLVPAHQRDQIILRQVLSGQNSRIVMLDDNETLLRFTNYPWNKVYRTQFIRRIGLRFSETSVQNDIYAHWQSLLAASRILVTDFVQCTKTDSASGSRISNTWDGRRVQAFSALRETYALVQRNPLPRVETAFWAFYQDLVSWMLRNAAPDVRDKMMQEHVRFAGIAPMNMTDLERDTGIKPWSLWAMDNLEDNNPASLDERGTPIEPEHLEIWLSEISRLKRLSAELRAENDRLRQDIKKIRGEKDLLHNNITELSRRLNKKAVRWALALRAAVKRAFPGRRAKAKR